MIYASKESRRTQIAFLILSSAIFNSFSKLLFLDNSRAEISASKPNVKLFHLLGSSFLHVNVVVVQNNGREMYKKSVLHVQSCIFLLIRPIVGFHRSSALPSPLSATRFYIFFEQTMLGACPPTPPPPPPSQANINTYFSLRAKCAKCWFRGGVGGQFPRNV